MGADIHAYLEYKEKGDSFWRSMTKNYGSRDYIWFGIVAGVRMPELQKFELKGLPTNGDLHYSTMEDYRLYIDDENPDDDGRCSMKRALEWIEQGCSVPIYKPDGVTLWGISNPDIHSINWFNSEELEQAIIYYNELVENNENYNWRGKNPAEWLAALAAMKTFEMLGGQARLIFWFDN